MLLKAGRTIRAIRTRRTVRTYNRKGGTRHGTLEDHSKYGLGEEPRKG